MNVNLKSLAANGAKTINIANDDDSKRFIHTLMERGKKIEIEFKNRRFGGYPYIWVTSPEFERGNTINPTFKNAEWLVSYIISGTVGIIPENEDEGEDEDDKHENFGREMLEIYLDSMYKDKVKFEPLYLNQFYVKAKIRFAHGCINFSVPKTEEFVDWLLENEYAA